MKFFHKYYPPQTIIEEANLEWEVRHKTHNISDKFLIYMQSWLPVQVNINRGNDLAKVIYQEGVGRSSEGNSIVSQQQQAEELLNCRIPTATSLRCKDLYVRMFSPVTAVQQIVDALESQK